MDGVTEDNRSFESGIAGNAPWLQLEGLGPKPVDSLDYGWVDDYGVHPCSGDDLVRRCKRVDLPRAIWTPDSPNLEVPTSVALVRALWSNPDRQAKRSTPAIVLAGLAALCAAYGVSPAPYSVFGYVFCMVLLAGSVALLIERRVQIRRLRRRIMPDAVARDTEAAQYGIWLSSQKAGYTNGIVVSLVVVGLMQLITGGVETSVESAGLVKASTRSGEWWRLGTAAFLHAGFLHLWYNSMAIQALGRFVEVLGRRSYVLFVFSFAAVGGSLLSLWVLPNAASVGASGGVMGLLAYLLVLRHRRPSTIPVAVVRSLWGAVGLNVVIGVIGFSFIDNAAHAGGAITGALLGICLPLRSNNTEAPAPRFSWDDAVAMALFAAMGLAAVVALTGG